MASTRETSVRIGRKPGSGHAYAAVPEHRLSTETPISPSSRKTSDATNLIDESEPSHTISIERDLDRPLLPVDEEATAGGQEDQASREIGRQPCGDQDVDKSDFKDHKWTPFWLHWATLVAFCALFLSLLVGLIILYYFARRNNGISTQMTSNHYYWTYGPTAMLMVVVALWRQVDYTCRQLTPWEELSVLEANAQKSLLLDYISPFLTTSLFRAIKSRHWSVVASLTGFMLLKLITIFSTGLLVLSPTHIVDHSTHFETSSTISAKNYCSLSKPSGSKCSISGPSINAILNYEGILSNRVPYPEGTTSRSMFEVLDIPRWTPPGAIITATVKGYYPKLTCKVASVHNNAGLPPRSEYNPLYAGDSALNDRFSVSLKNRTWMVDTDMFSYCNPSIVPCPSRAVTPHDLGMTLHGLNGTNSDNSWPLLVTDVLYNQTIVPTLDPTKLSKYAVMGAVNVTEWSVHVESTTMLLCETSYSIEDTLIRIDTAQNDTNAFIQAEGPLTQTGDHLEGYTDIDVYWDFFDLTTSVYLTEFAMDDAHSGPSIFDLMSQMHAVDDKAELLDPKVLTDGASQAFGMLAAQMALGDLRVMEKKNLTGSMEYFEDRLHVKPVSFWAMTAGFAGMLVLTVSIFGTRPMICLPYEPVSLGDCACILALQKEIPASGQQDSWDLPPNGVPQEFRRLVLQQQHDTKLFGSWPPFASSKIFRAASLTMTLATIAVLAVLQYISDVRNGIADVQSSSNLSHSLSTYIPAAFMLLLATLCTSAAFVVTTLYPYYQLQRRRAKAEGSVLLNICGKSPSLVLYISLRHLLVAPVCISIASILSAFLTIVVSGLYTAAPVPLLRPVSVTQLDRFNLTWNSAGSDNRAMTVLNLFEHSNASLPSFTFNELAIPTIDFSKDQSTVTENLNYNSSFSLSVAVPVLRGSLNCTVVPKADFRVVEVPYYNNTGCEELSCGLGVAGNIPLTEFRVNARPAPYCNLPGQYDKMTALNYTLKLIYPTNDFEGGLTSLAGCPSLAFTLGYFSNNQTLQYKHQDTTNKDNVTSVVCSQYIEEAVTDVHFLLPSLAIDASRPPVFNSSNSRVVSTEQWDIGAQTGQLSNYPQYGFTGPSDYSGSTAPLDPFMEIVLSGKSGIPVNELIRPADADKFVDAVQRVYRLYMAQAINANMRQNFSTPAGSRRELSLAGQDTAPKTLNATLLDPTRWRLVQNRTSTIILEVLIGLILILSIAAYITMHMNDVLPHNPCSIAGMVSLLDGSRFCDLLSGHMPFENEKERKKLFREWRFSLGWWDENGNLVQKGKGNDSEVRFGIDIES